MVDKTLILRKLAELEEYLGQVNEYTSITVDRYSKDWKTQRVVEKTLQMMIETCTDIAGHIIQIKDIVSLQPMPTPLGFCMKAVF